MKQINNWENIKEAGEFESLVPGGYIAIIRNVEDDPQKECLKISYDVAEGKFKGYYQALYESQNFWGGNFFRSYKETAQSFFKGFITAVEKSNAGYKFNFDERTLKGKAVGLVLGEEEYVPTQGKNAGHVRKRLYVASVRSVDEIRKGNFEIPAPKLLDDKTEARLEKQQEEQKDPFDILDDDLQF